MDDNKLLVGGRRIRKGMQGGANITMNEWVLVQTMTQNC